METVGLIEGSQSGLKAEAKDGFPEEILQNWGWGVYFQGLAAALYRLRGQGAEEAGLSSGGRDMERRDLESPPELLCAGWWKREILGPASEYGERQ